MRCSSQLELSLRPHDEPVIRLSIVSGACVDLEGDELVLAMSVGGVPVEPGFGPADFSGLGRSHVRGGLVSPWYLQVDERLAPECDPGRVAYSGAVSASWKVEPSETDPHVDAVQLLAEVHASLTDDGWDAIIEQLGESDSRHSPPLVEERRLVATLDDMAAQVLVSFSDATTELTHGTQGTAADLAGENLREAHIFVAETPGPCVADLGHGALSLTEGDWRQISDPLEPVSDA